MRCLSRRLTLGTWVAAWMASGALAQKTLTWEEAKRELQASNPTLRASQIGIQESRADEITAYLRPNPDLTVSVDQINPFTGNPYRPFADTLPLVSEQLPAWSGGTSANYGARAPRKARPSPFRNCPIRSEICFSTCAPLSCRCSSRKPCSRHAREP